MKKIFILFLFFFSLNSLLMAQEQNLTKEQLFKLFNQATLAEKEGRVADAINIYENIVKYAPQIPETYLRMGKLFSKNEDRNSIETAIAQYKNYLALKPNVMDANEIRNIIAQLKLKLNSLQETEVASDATQIPIGDLGKKVEILESPKNLPIKENNEIEQPKTPVKEDNEVENSENRTVQEDKETERAKSFPTKENNETDKHEEAIKEVDPQLPTNLQADFYTENGYASYDKSDFKSAINYFNKAIVLGESADLYYILCLSYVGMKNVDSAKFALRNYQRLAPDGTYLRNLRNTIKDLQEETRNWRESELRQAKFLVGINLRYAPNFSITYNDYLYKNNPLFGIGVEYISGTDSPLKFSTELSFVMIKISQSMDTTGIFYYPWGDRNNYIYNMDIKVKARYIHRYPAFHIGKISGRFLYSLGGGLGYLSATENPIIYYPPNEDGKYKNSSKFLSGLLSYVSYEATCGVFLSPRYIPTGLKLELVGSGHWQFETKYQFKPYLGVQVGWLFGVKVRKR